MFRGHCYYGANTTGSTWHEASLACQKLNDSSLVAITSEEEQNFLVANILPNYPAIRANTRNSVWTGLNDKDAEGIFVWSQRNIPLSATGYSKWAKNEPNNAGTGEDCVALWKFDGDYAWNDELCARTSFNQGFICELEPSGLPKEIFQ